MYQAALRRRGTPKHAHVCRLYYICIYVCIYIYVYIYVYVYTGCIKKKYTLRKYLLFLIVRKICFAKLSVFLSSLGLSGTSKNKIISKTKFLT